MLNMVDSPLKVLAPAGGWPQLRAAVRAGADAVYFGLDVGLNARARAANFTTEELPEVMKFLHSHGVTWRRRMFRTT
jgi:collagenase-like PrtC family protease